MSHRPKLDHMPTFESTSGSGMVCPETMRPFSELSAVISLQVHSFYPDFYQNCSSKDKVGWVPGGPVVGGGVRKGVGACLGGRRSVMGKMCVLFHRLLAPSLYLPQPLCFIPRVMCTPSATSQILPFILPQFSSVQFSRSVVSLSL